MEFDTSNNISAFKYIPYSNLTWADLWTEIDARGLNIFDSVSIIVLFLALITFVYLIRISFRFFRRKEDNDLEAEVKGEPELPESAWPKPTSSPERIKAVHELRDDEDIVEEIHFAAARVNQKYYEDRCIALLQQCPEAVNYPMAPLMFTPFLRACWWGNARVVEHMLKIGADITSHTKDGDTPMYLAVYRATKIPRIFDPSCINALYEAGCDINEPKFHGYTPLHLAAKAGHANLVRWLLVHGADPDCLTKGNKKPVDIANGHGHRKVVSLLTVKTGDERRGKTIPIPASRSRYSFSSIGQFKN